MSLDIFSGPSLEDDVLNECNECSIQMNAKKMVKYSCPWLEDHYSSNKHLPSMLNVPLRYYPKK